MHRGSSYGYVSRGRGDTRSTSLRAGRGQRQKLIVPLWKLEGEWLGVVSEFCKSSSREACFGTRLRSDCFEVTKCAK